MKLVRLALIIAILNFLFSAYYLFVGLRLSALYSNFNVSPETTNPVLNKYFLGFLILAIFSFAFWGYLKRRLNKGLVGYDKLISITLLLLASPFIYLTFQLIYSLITIYIIVPLII